MSAPKESHIIDALRPVEDPELHRSIVDLGMVRSIDIDRKGGVRIEIALTVAGCPLRNEIQQRVSTAVRDVKGVTGIDLQFGVMSDEERAKVRHVMGGAGHGEHGHSHGGGHGHAENESVGAHDRNARSVDGRRPSLHPCVRRDEQRWTRRTDRPVAGAAVVHGS